MNTTRGFVTGISLFAVISVDAQDFEIPSEWIDSGMQVIQQLDTMGIDVTQLVNGPPPAEWQQFWTGIESSLHSESLDEMAWMLPEVKAALGLLDQVPSARPYADWLRQRLDYFEMASEVLQEEEEVAPPPRKPEGKPRIVTPKKPVPPSPPSPQKRAVSNKKAADLGKWEKKLASRPAPKNAAQLVPGLKRVFRAEGIPEALVWMAEVESSFDPAARSPVGATGLFQFMPATAKRFGLQVSPTDERLQPNRIALAAAKYLKFLHRRFGSWPLAMAAYNAGEGRVGGLLSKHKATTFDQIADKLPLETRMYVPKIIATVKLREGVDARTLPGPG